MNQLNLLIIFILFFASGIGDCSAQVKSKKLSEAEIGINTIQFSDLARYDFYGSVSGELKPSLGIVYKARVTRKNSFRASTSFLIQSSHNESNNSMLTGSWDFKDAEQNLSATLGLEQNMSNGRVSTYLFADIYQQFGRREKKGYSVGCFYYDLWDYSYRYYQVGLAAGVGIKIKIINKLHLNIESHTRVLREFKTDDYYNNRRKQYQAYFNPVSRLSLNLKL